MRDLFRLETRALTVAFWSAVAAFMAAFWLARFPPLIDYPQHVAVAAMLRRLADPASPERALFEVDLVTYNGGFHLLVAALSFLVSPETAGKLVISLYPPLLGLAALELCRIAGRPRWYALLVLPITFSFAVGWGFANYFVSVPIALLAFGWWLRWWRGEPGMLPRLAAVAFVLAYSHVLVTLCLCVCVGVAALASWSSLGATWGARLRGLLRAPWPLWPAFVWCITVFVHNRRSSHANWEGWDDGLDDPLWYKLLHATAFAVGNFSDYTDQAILAAALVALVALYQSRERRAGAHVVMGALAVTWAALYCVVPKVFIATWFIFERFPTWALVFAVAAAPLVGEATLRRVRPIAAALALAAGLNTAWHLAHLPDQRDADAILDDIPEGARVVAVTWSTRGEPVVLRESWVHLLAYYQARRRGLIGYSFLKFESMPVHYRPEARPPQVAGGLEWDARKYDVDSDYARWFPTVLVRTPDDHPADDPRLVTFGERAGDARLLSHRGRFWLFDASAATASR